LRKEIEVLGKLKLVLMNFTTPQKGYVFSPFQFTIQLGDINITAK